MYIDGKKVGPTPLIKHPVRAGVVKVRLVNKEFGVDHIETIRIKANAGTKKRIVLKRP